MSSPHSSFGSSHSSFRLIVGLGNPGRQYVGTRHNIGWEVIDQLAVTLGWLSSPAEFDRQARQKFEGLMYDGLLSAGEADIRLLMLKPTTYMNLSGQSVRAALDFYQLAPAGVLVVLDEMALPCGSIRLRAGGSHGGHNGLRDIERALGTPKYPRLRLGVDSPPPRVPGRDYVLGRFSDEQRSAMDRAVGRAADAVKCWAVDGVEAAMNKFNAALTGGDDEVKTGGRSTGQNPS